MLMWRISIGPHTSRSTPDVSISSRIPYLPTLTPVCSLLALTPATTLAVMLHASLSTPGVLYIFSYF